MKTDKDEFLSSREGLGNGFPTKDNLKPVIKSPGERLVAMSLEPVWSKNSKPTVEIHEIQDNAAARFPETDLKQV